MKKTIFIFLVLTSIYNGFTQNQAKVDSLLQRLNTKIKEEEKVDIYTALAKEYSGPDSLKTLQFANKAINLSKEIEYYTGTADAYSQIGWTNMLRGHYTKATDAYQKALKISKKTKYKKGESAAYNGLGAIEFQQGKYTNAIDHFITSMQISEEIKDLAAVASRCNNIGAIYFRQGANKKAIEYHLKSLNAQQNLNNKRGIAHSYHNIGLVYYDQGNYSKSLENNLKALAIREELNEQHTLGQSYTNIGLIYDSQKKYPEAIEYYSKALNIARQTGIKSSIAINLGVIGDLYSYQSNHEQAMTYYLEALEIEKEIDYKYGMAISYINIGRTYLYLKNYTKALENVENGKQLCEEIGDKSNFGEALTSMGLIHYEMKNFALARKYLDDGIRIATEIGNLEELVHGTEALSHVESSLGHHKAALKSYELYHRYYDSLLGEEKTKQISQLQIQYETEKKEQEIKNLAQQTSIQALELKQANLNKTIYAAIAVFILLIAAVLFLVNKQKQLQLKQRAQNIEQNLLRVQMNPHFIFNAMTSIQEYMNKGDAKQASLYLVKFSKLIRQVLDNSRNEFIPLEQEINMLENYLSIQNLKRDFPFTHTIELQDGLDAEEIAIPPMFSQPFIENAIEHGLTSVTENANINIHFSMEKEYLVLRINDNGIGIEEAVKVKKTDHLSHAIKITEERIDLYRKMQKKEIDFNIKNLSQGTQITFNLPFQYI